MLEQFDKMFILKVLTSPHFLAVLLFLTENHWVCTINPEDENRFFGESETAYLEGYPSAKNWFRVRQQDGTRRNVRDGDINRVAKSFESSSPEFINEEAIPEVERYHELPSKSIRNPRRYAPPVYSSDPRYPVSGNNDNNQCRCDMEYVLKYRGIYPGGNRPPGTYHVKVYHEETGHFTGDDRNEEPTYHSSRDNYERNDKKYHTYPGSSTSRSQQQRPAEYYVEEVAEPVDRRGTFSRGNAKPVSSTIVRGGDDERVVYKARNPRAKPSSSFRKLVKLARAIVHTSNWATLSFSSSIESEFGGYPYSQYVRISDGTLENSTGIPYLYLTNSVLEASFQSELEIPGVSLTITQNLSDDNYDSCEEKRSGVWPCASVTMSGIIVPITATDEIEQAAESLMSRHSQKQLKKEGFLARIIIKNIVVQHQISGYVQMLPVNDYLY